MASRKESIPTFASLIEFIRDQDKIFKTTGINKTNIRVNQPTATYARKPPQPQAYVTVANSQKCLCNDQIVHDHLYKCPAFGQMKATERYDAVKNLNACVNCLSVRHKVSGCLSQATCRACNKWHHTSLHFEPRQSQQPTVTAAITNDVESAEPPQSPETETPNCLVNSLVSLKTTTATAASNCFNPIYKPAVNGANVDKSARNRNTSRAPDEVKGEQPTTILLATAMVNVTDALGRQQQIRCLLDSASQSNFLTLDSCKRLGLHRNTEHRQKVKGLGGTEKSVMGSTSFVFSSRFDPEIKYSAVSLIVDNITANLPTAPVDKSSLPHLKGLRLADDSFGTPGRIDALLGASIFPHLVLPGVIKAHGLPPVIDTVLGYMLMGSVPALHLNVTDPLVNCCMIQRDDNNEKVDSLLQRFWQIEESPSGKQTTLSTEELECEYFYKETTTRDKEGRYTVALPFCADAELLGDSYETARKRFLCLEKKLQSSSSLRSAYDDVISEYLDKGYLTPAPITERNEYAASYVIPHHAVIRQDKSTTKLRAVLDASCKTSTGLSLNDILHSGPNLQRDLFTIILNYRLFAVALSADCKQMFLQIAVRPEDRKFQRILFRFNVKEPIKVYEYSRVCFGLKSSPFHALRTVHQLISDEGDKFPIAREVASDSLYMDDIVFSERSTEKAIAASQELIEFFKKGQLDLVKWTSNSKTVLDNIPVSHRNNEQFEFDKAQCKILGLRWSHVSDCFEFQVIPPSNTCTKRNILSTVARLWDIMGFVAPVVLYAKLLIKELWLLKLDWDDCPPQHIADIWQRFCINLPQLNALKIPRHLGVFDGCTIRLLAFADASEKAYGTVVYLHITKGVHVTVQLVCAKSKVSPVKPLSIARLELCAVELMSRLLRQVHDTYNPRYNVSDMFAFTDSKVTLCWLNSSPHRWQTFVANRVVKTIDNIPANHFFHVAGINNPADCLSRGLTPDKLIDHPLWFNGPPWAILSPSEWPINRIEESDSLAIPEEKVHVHAVVVQNELHTPIQSLSERVSSWTKLIRVVVYIFRFAKRLPRRESVSVTASDEEYAERKILRDVQQRYFQVDIENVKAIKKCDPALMKLRPFMSNDILCVGGRLGNSAESFRKKHPAVLPRHDRIIDLLVDYYHQKYLHAGPEHLMSLLRERYWILAARRIIRQRVHKCNTCYKMKPRPIFTPVMSDLPEQRVNQVVKAFTYTGCDYAGPISYTPLRSRGVKSRKAYICVFTCLTTRAIHIEVATDLSTANFILALKRFLSRRGPVCCMYSDNGTNFVGTKSYLRDLYDFLNKEYTPHFEEELRENRITWKNIPPATPHQGGCWESMVKCVKNHLFKSIGQQILSYEELVTVLAQIECLLNSRPLTALSSDPSELSALTPAHFLHTAPLNSLPAPEVTLTINQIRERHTLMDKLVQSFWKRWKNEYLHQLQTREKWNTDSASIKTGMVVIIINDNSPTLSWPLGVVESLHTSKDGRVRTVTVRTAKGVLVRPVVRLCPLPTQ